MRRRFILHILFVFLFGLIAILGYVSTIKVQGAVANESKFYVLPANSNKLKLEKLAVGTKVPISLSAGLPDFGIIPDTTLWEINANSTVTYSLYITGSETFTDLVSLSLNGLPDGINSLFVPNPAPPNMTADAIISALPTVVPGVYGLSIIGVGDIISDSMLVPITHTVAISLTILSEVNPSPTSTSTFTLTPTPTRTRIPTRTPTSTKTRTRTPTPTKTPTRTRTPTPSKTPTRARTPTPAFNIALLPLVNRLKSTPTPTSTETPTRTPVTTPVLFPNGDFEQGRVIWVEYSNNGYELIYQNSNLPVPPYDGVWAAWLGYIDNEIDSISQPVFVPSNLPYMSYRLWIDSEELCGYASDVAGVWVDNILVDVYELCSDNNTNGWIQHVLDLHADIGKTVNIEFLVGTDISNHSSLFIDHVAFQSNMNSQDNTVSVDKNIITKLNKMKQEIQSKK